EAPFARHLGVAVNMKQAGSETDEMIHELLLANREMACFPDAVPMIHHIQKSALCALEPRSFQNKYPGEAGRALRAIAGGLLQRITAGNAIKESVLDQSPPPSDRNPPQQNKPLGMFDKLRALAK